MCTPAVPGFPGVRGGVSVRTVGRFPDAAQSGPGQAGQGAGGSTGRLGHDAILAARAALSSALSAALSGGGSGASPGDQEARRWRRRGSEAGRGRGPGEAGAKRRSGAGSGLRRRATG